MYKSFVTLVLFIFSFSCFSQLNTLSKDAEISIITIGPGNLLYDSFGHNAIRVEDPTNAKDIVFNYGTFDFKTPNFYLKFARGKLPYALSVRTYNNFIYNYIQENRWVKEQKLHLSYGEKVTMYNYLLNNALPENKEYKYDFFFDNCSTRIRDVLDVTLAKKLAFQDAIYVPTQYTFRTLIQQRLDWNTWGSLGIDIALGAIIDKTATPSEHQYLPEYTLAAVKSAHITRNGKQEPLAKETITSFEATPKNKTSTFFKSPFFVLLLLGLCIIYITYKDVKRNKRSAWLDGALFFITGSIGVLLLLLWVATDHTATANNYNMLWGFPLNLFLFTLLWKKTPKKWLGKYVFLLILFLVLLTIHWLTGVQVFALSLVPFLVALAIRYLYLAWYFKK